MEPREFRKAIVSDELRGLYDHWNDVRGSRLLPGWRDIRPQAIRSLLKNVWSWKFDREQSRFTGRIAGERIEEKFGVSFRGLTLAAIDVAPNAGFAFARFHRVVTAPAFFRGHGLVFQKLDRFDIGERIILPLGDDGENGDGIIGATLFRSNPGVPTREVTQPGENEEWYELR